MLKTDGYLQPFVLQLLGIAMLVAFAVIWATTGHESGLLVGAAVALIGVGSGVGAIITVRQQLMDRIDDEPYEPSRIDAKPAKPAEGSDE